MKLVSATSQYRVFDDVLSPDELDALWSYAQAVDYRRVHAGAWQKVWRTLDGEPLAGPIAYSQEPGALPEGAVGRVFPTGSELDTVVSRVAREAPGWHELIGHHEEAWNWFSAQIYLYPRETGLSWHSDRGGPYTGSFILYAHPTWNSQWGGELLVADESTRDADTSAGEVIEHDPRDPESFRLRKLRPSLDNARESRVLMERGMGTFIAPRPNRLVVLAAGAAHMINRVHPAAGDHVRCSVAGFFIANDGER